MSTFKQRSPSSLDFHDVIVMTASVTASVVTFVLSSPVISCKPVASHLPLSTGSSDEISETCRKRGGRGGLVLHVWCTCLQLRINVSISPVPAACSRQTSERQPEVGMERTSQSKLSSLSC